MPSIAGVVLPKLPLSDKLREDSEYESSRWDASRRDIMSRSRLNLSRPRSRSSFTSFASLTGRTVSSGTSTPDILGIARHAPQSLQFLVPSNKKQLRWQEQKSVAGDYYWFNWYTGEISFDNPNPEMNYTPRKFLAESPHFKVPCRTFIDGASWDEQYGYIKDVRTKTGYDRILERNPTLAGNARASEDMVRETQEDSLFGRRRSQNPSVMLADAMFKPEQSYFGEEKEESESDDSNASSCSSVKNIYRAPVVEKSESATLAGSASGTPGGSLKSGSTAKDKPGSGKRDWKTAAAKVSGGRKSASSKVTPGSRKSASPKTIASGKSGSSGKNTSSGKDTPQEEEKEKGPILLDGCEIIDIKKQKEVKEVGNGDDDIFTEKRRNKAIKSQLDHILYHPRGESKKWGVVRNFVRGREQIGIGWRDMFGNIVLNNLPQYFRNVFLHE